jgi:hypothetical protein
MGERIKCKQCGGYGRGIDYVEVVEPCGHCRACDRGDPSGCTRPMTGHDPVETPCRSCYGYGYYELEE